MIKVASKHGNRKKIYSIANETRKYLRKANVQNVNGTNLEHTKTKPQKN